MEGSYDLFADEKLIEPAVQIPASQAKDGAEWNTIAVWIVNTTHVIHMLF